MRTCDTGQSRWSHVAVAHASRMPPPPVKYSSARLIVHGVQKPAVQPPQPARVVLYKADSATRIGLTLASASDAEPPRIKSIAPDSLAATAGGALAAGMQLLGGGPVLSLEHGRRKRGKERVIDELAARSVALGDPALLALDAVRATDVRCLGSAVTAVLTGRTTDELAALLVLPFAYWWGP